MRKMAANVVFLVAGAATFASLGACSTSSSPKLDAGERMQARGAQISHQGDDWASGQKDVKEGKRLVERSQDRTKDAEKKRARATNTLADAEQKITEAEADRIRGERLVSEGAVKMDRAAAGYSTIRSGPPAIDVPPAR